MDYIPKYLTMYHARSFFIIQYSLPLEWRSDIYCCCPCPVSGYTSLKSSWSDWTRQLAINTAQTQVGWAQPRDQNNFCLSSYYKDWNFENLCLHYSAAPTSTLRFTVQNKDFLSSNLYWPASLSTCEPIDLQAYRPSQKA